ncbi:MAG: MBL fold metallo-hydrolase, partial [Gemmatimonadota bacterium]
RAEHGGGRRGRSTEVAEEGGSIENERETPAGSRELERVGGGGGRWRLPDLRRDFMHDVIKTGSTVVTVAAILAAPPVAAGAAAQQDFSQVEIVTTPVSGNVFMLTGSGGNIGVSAGPDGILIVDDQFAPLAEKIRKALRELTRKNRELKYVLNTHWHGDHTGGNVEFGPEAPVIAQANVRKRLATEQHLRGRIIGPTPEEGLPVITFGDSLSIHFNGEEIRALHFPNGHTDGDAVIFFTNSNVVHMGDDFFAGRFPFIDLESGGSVRGLIRAVGLVLEQIPADAKVIPGHGSLSTVDDLRAFRRMLEETSAIVGRRIAEKQSLEQIKAAGLPEEWAEWGSGFISTDLWLETLYRSLSAESR